MRWISSLHHPTARISINGTLSSLLELFNGTRQGCPLPPILFIILEPLLAAIRKNPDIKGIRVGEREYRVAAFADNLLCYVSNPRTTIPIVLKELNHYGKLTNFKKNMAKSEILNITLLMKEQTVIQPKFPFMWCREELGYLGIKLIISPG